MPRSNGLAQVNLEVVRTPLTRVAVAMLGLLTSTVAASAQIDVTTDASASATYPIFSQSAGPFPWSDLGVSASALVTAGGLSASVGGSTSYTFNTTLTGGSFVLPSSTTFDLGYNPSAWSGSIGASSAGAVNSNFSYNIGPFNGSYTIANANVSTGVAGNLAAALNGGGPGLGTGTNAAPLGGLSLTLSATAGPCPVCATVASVTASMNVGAQLNQAVTWAPTVTYGDYVWYSATQTYSAADDPVFVAGSSDQVQNTAPNVPSSLQHDGTLYLNILPAVQLTMPIGNSADVAVPATFSISGDIFGGSFGQSFPLGDLYDLQTGVESFDFDAAWFGGEFYSIPLTAGDCSVFFAGCEYQIPLGGSLGEGSDGIPLDMLPTGFTGGPWPDGVSGPGTSNLGNLFPNGACPVGESPGGPDCITNVSVLTGTAGVPEPNDLVLMITGFLGLGIALRRRRRLRSSLEQTPASR
jgi:hypothetical protein